MNYYALETQMFEKQREMLHDAKMRRLAASASEQPAVKAGRAPRISVRAAVARAFRAVVAS